MDIESYNIDDRLNHCFHIIDKKILTASFEEFEGESDYKLLMIHELYDFFQKKYSQKLPVIEHIDHDKLDIVQAKLQGIYHEHHYTQSTKTIDWISIIKKRDQEILKVANSYAKKNTCLIQ
jgi:hypothetical protein